jgi:hypothetical protein
MSYPQPELHPSPPPMIAPYHPPPTFSPPQPAAGSTAGQAVTSFALAVLGLLLGLPFGVPGLVLGPVAYFLGRAAIGRIDASNGTLGGRSLAMTGWIIGVAATAVGAIVTLFWLILFLIAISSPETTGPTTLG